MSTRVNFVTTDHLFVLQSNGDKITFLINYARAKCFFLTQLLFFIHKKNPQTSLRVHIILFFRPSKGVKQALSYLLLKVLIDYLFTG